jgi:hypothetical protein
MKDPASNTHNCCNLTRKENQVLTVRSNSCDRPMPHKSHGRYVEKELKQKS